MDEIKNTKINKDEILETLNKMAGFMDIKCRLEFKEDKTDDQGENVLVISIQTSDDARFLIGRNGQNLKSLEHVIRAMHVKGNKQNNLIIDVNDYRKLKSDFIISIAKEAVAKVRSTQKAEALFPMSAYERRIVHMELAASPDIATESVGAEPQRRVIIKPYP